MTMAEKDSSDSDGPIIDDNIIRIQLRKSSQRKWELRTRNFSPGMRFPTIQLFDCDGNLLVETNDENLSIRSSEFNDCSLRTSKSLHEKGFRHAIHKTSIKKHNTISGGKVYTRVFNTPRDNQNNVSSSYVIKDSDSVTNIPSKLTVNGYSTGNYRNNLHTTSFQSEGCSEASSYKSSDNETCEDINRILKITNESFRKREKGSTSSINCSLSSLTEHASSSYRENEPSLHKSQSFNEAALKGFPESTLVRSKSGVKYDFPHNKVSFLNTYLKNLPVRADSNPEFMLHRTIGSNPPTPTSPSKRPPKCFKNVVDSASDDPSIAEVNCEIKKRLKMYRRGISKIEPKSIVNLFARSHSLSGMTLTRTSSSESVDEADVVLNRLKRRILRNKLREKRRSLGVKFQFHNNNGSKNSDRQESEGWRDAGGGAPVRSRQDMGSNISQHSSKGLKGRRARSSGDLCNGDNKSQTESSVCGSVVGDVMGWNRSLPNHLDGNRHLADYSRVNNNYAEFGTYNRCHPKGGRGLRYRVSKSGSDAEPVWKLQDPGFDQGYGSERSPEDDYVPPIVPPISLEAYEAELRTVYPFITDENTFTVVVEKDGRGLGMSVCGGGGLVRIRRLYPPQPAWRTGMLAQRDLLLSANGVPLAGLSTYEALEVLRTASARVELRVCRPPPDVLESVTPPDPPTPPTRTPLPPHLPPLDPLNCHPMHARLSATTSSATTSSSEGRGRREASPEIDRRNLHLPDLDRPLPVYDIQYGEGEGSLEIRWEVRLLDHDGSLPLFSNTCIPIKQYDDGSVEFDIVMTKVNGSLGFTLRKEDHSALGHYVRALVREPALSDGRIQPGDRIVAVNDTPMSNMSHAEAVAFLRACGIEVRLRLYRDHAATPVSPMSPKEEGPSESDAPLNRPKPPLRAEAVSMLCDLAARRLTPDAADGSRSPCLSPRKFRKLTKDNNHYEQPNDATDLSTLEIHTDSVERTKPLRAPSVAITSPTAPPSCRKQKLSLTVPPHGYELNNLDNDTLDAPNYQEDISRQRYGEPAFPIDSDEPVSMPVELSSDEAKFKHANPAYQSAVLHTSSDGASDAHKDDGMKKWKGVALSPDNDRKAKIDKPAQKPIAPPPPKTAAPPPKSAAPPPPKMAPPPPPKSAPPPPPSMIDDAIQKENINPKPSMDESNTEPTQKTDERSNPAAGSRTTISCGDSYAVTGNTIEVAFWKHFEIVTVELNRGWNSRLGFSVQSHPDSGQSYISAVYNDSVAARDGRLRQGDVILQVNDENVTSMKTPEVIDLLRILRGSICITVLRPPSP